MEERLEGSEHYVIVEAWVETLSFRHIGAVNEEYAVSCGGTKMLGVLVSHLPRVSDSWCFCKLRNRHGATKEVCRAMQTPVLESTTSPEAGKRLRSERLRSRLSAQAVQKLRQKIAREKDNN